MPAYLREIANELAHLQQPVDFDKRFRLTPSERLPELQSPGTLAIGVASLKSDGRSLFALVCQKEAAPRFSMIRLMNRINCSAMVTPLASGTIIFPDDNVRRFVIIYDRPSGNRLVQQYGQPVSKMGEEEILTGVIHNLLPAFRELSTRTLMHRAIRPDNVYITSDGRATLGECLSPPAAYAQPVLYGTSPLC
ncbi:hypothetical protein [Kiloniella sp.]|uniref:hypothetical protein n=1 Tax=Kiloniella sp. TaxID=1938587 RepID=UPI003B0263F1